MKFQTLTTLNVVTFREFIKKQNYERYILEIINRSKKIFAGKHFIYVVDQAHGECDFVDECDQKYDAKLLFDKRQGQLIGDAKNDLREWIQVMVDEKIEFAKSIEQRDLSYVVYTQLYGIMKKRIETVREDEIALLFIPFPVVDDYPGAVFMQWATDFLQAVYDRLKIDGHIRCKNVFFIYPSIELNVYVLRAANRNREYIRYEDLESIISYETRVVS